MNHYDTIANAIRYVRSVRHEQPELEDIASHVGLSAGQLQRVFTRWAGVSPKRFLQYLTKQHARTLLRCSSDVLATSIDTGLSSPGRLHDLMVTCEAMSPGEVALAGAGIVLRHGFLDTPLGRVIVGITARGICHLRFVDAGDAAALAELADEWPQAQRQEDRQGIAALAPRLLPALGAAPPAPLSLLLKGSNFQLKVWEALLRIPVGSAVSYGELAAMIGQPRAARAVGSAVAANRIAVLIPCHRVLREDGDFGQYRWTSERKVALLVREQQAPAFAVGR